MPLHFRDNPASTIPERRLVHEIMVEHDWSLRRASDRPRQEVLDLPLQDIVRRQPDCIAISLGLESFVDVRIGECRIPSEEQSNIEIAIAGDDGIEHFLPVLRAVDIPLPEHGPLEVAELVEAEQGMVAGAAEVAVVRRSLLPAVGLAHRAVHVQHDPRELPRLLDAIDPFPRELRKSDLVLLRGEHLCLEPANLARRRRCPLYCPTADNLTHSGIDGEPIGVVGVLVPGEAGENRLPELCPE